jgi:hypothetical protein
LNILIYYTPFSDKQGINYAFYKSYTNSEITENKVRTFYTGLLLAIAADRGARSHLSGHVGQAEPRPLRPRSGHAMPARPARLAGRRRSPATGKGRGAGEKGRRITLWMAAGPTEAGSPKDVESGDDVRRLLRRNGDAGGDSRPLGLIPWTRQIRERRQSSWHLRLRPGRRETEGLDGGHGGGLGRSRGEGRGDARGGRRS